ncbi:MAG TPA: hypothetical protein VNZ58_07870 [Thermomicrobiales bacterium]|nr:hypothetical protein [Thermomicrobiales bacterium]
MVSNQAPDPRDESDPQTHGIPESGSDVDEVRNEVPGASQPTGASVREISPPNTETAASGSSVREPGKGPDKDVQFDRNPAMSDNDAAPRPARAGIIGTGMFFTAVIILIVAVIVILWFAL